jgi:hypothetical protein
MSHDFGWQFETAAGECVIASFSGPICVLGQKTLYYRHCDPGPVRTVVKRIQDGEPVAKALGPKARVLPIESIVSVGKSDSLKTTIINYTMAGKSQAIRITTPKLDMYAKVFETIHGQLAGDQPLQDAPYPLGLYYKMFGVFAVIMAILLVSLCCIAADAEHGKTAHQVVHGSTRSSTAFAVFAAFVAETIGLKNMILLSCAVLVAFAGACFAFVSKHKTMRLVQIERGEYKEH